MILQPTIAQLKQSITAWAMGQADIRALILVGSRARKEKPGSEFSDLDLFIFTDQVANYMADRSWIETFGEVLLCTEFRTAGGDPELLTLFYGFQGVDFVFVPAEHLKGISSMPELPDVFRRGYQIWVDKEGIAGQIAAKTGSAPIVCKKPSREEFQGTITSFLFCAYYIARILFQKDLWLAKVRENDLRFQLLRMLEWHSGAKSNWNRDTWHMGKYMEEWAEPAIVKELSGLFTGYSIKESFQGLEKAFILFESISSKTAALAGFEFPQDQFSKIRSFITEGMETVRNGSNSV